MRHRRTDSTYADQAVFASTLYNRPLDQLFVLDELARMTDAPDGFLAGLGDTASVGLIGYSMGGYGVVSVIGGGFTPASAAYDFAPPNGLLAERQARSAALAAGVDSRIRAAIAIAPWGMFDHYADAVWDSVRMNNIAQHFATAFLDANLKSDMSKQRYLDVLERAVAGVWSLDRQGVATGAHTYWPGFPAPTAIGLRLERLTPGDTLRES